MGYRLLLLLFDKNGFGIILSTKVNMPLNREIKLNQTMIFTLTRYKCAYNISFSARIVKTIQYIFFNISFEKSDIYKSNIVLP